MFTPPPQIKTEVFASLPDSLRIKNRPSAWLKWQMREKPMDSFLEGPSFDRQGNLYVVDIPYGRVFRISAGGRFDLLAEYDGEPNGLKIHKDGRIFIADYKNGIMLLDPRKGAVTPYCDRTGMERFKGVNDLFFAGNGDIYFTDQGLTGLHDPTGRVYRLRTDGELDLLLDTVPSPNGLVLDAGESTLFVAATRGNCVWRVPLLLNGRPAKVGIFVQMSAGVGPDGMAMDAEGNLAVCHPGLGAVWLFGKLGEPLYRIQSCTGLLPTNCAYGGPDNKSLFITESETGTILRAELPVAGRKMFSQL
jgi:gluconolactonase